MLAGRPGERIPWALLEDALPDRGQRRGLPADAARGVDRFRGEEQLAASSLEDKKKK